MKPVTSIQIEMSRTFFPRSVTLAIIFASESGRIRLGFVIKSWARTGIKAFLHSEMAAIARESKIPLKWISGKKRQEQWILADCPHGKLFDQKTWPEIYRWATEGMTRLRPAVMKRLASFRFKRTPTPRRRRTNQPSLALQ